MIAKEDLKGKNFHDVDLDPEPYDVVMNLLISLKNIRIGLPEDRSQKSIVMQATAMRRTSYIC